MLKLLAGSFLAFLALSHVRARATRRPSRRRCICVAFEYVFSSPRLALGPDRHLRDPLAGQDQRHQRLCRLDRLVEFLLAPDAQPSGPRGLAGVQRRHRAAADGTRRLQGARADARASIRSSPSPGSARWSPIWSINKPLGLSPPHIEFKRAHLYDINPGRRRRHDARDRWSALGAYRGAVRTDAAGAVALRRASSSRSSPRR